jgi:hypothetical protein
MGRGGTNLFYGQVKSSDKGQLEQRLDEYFIKQQFLIADDSQYLELIKSRNMPLFKSLFLRKLHDSIAFHHNKETDPEVMSMLGMFTSNLGNIQDQLASQIILLPGQEAVDSDFLYQANKYTNYCWARMERLLNRTLYLNSIKQTVKTDISGLCPSKTAAEIKVLVSQLKDDVNQHINKSYEQDDIDYDQAQDKEYASLIGLGLEDIQMTLFEIDASEHSAYSDLHETLPQLSWMVALNHDFELIEVLAGDPFYSKTTEYLKALDDCQKQLKELINVEV